MISHLTQSVTLHLTFGGCTDFNSFSKNSIKFGTWSLAFIGSCLKKKVVTSALAGVKQGRKAVQFIFV